MRRTETGINASFGYTDSESTNSNYTSSRFYQFGDSVRIVNHVIDNPSKRTNWGASARFRHRFGEFTNLRINYEFNYSKNTNSQAYNDVVGNAMVAIDSLHYDNKYKDVSHGPSMDFKFDNETFMFQFLGKAQPTVRTANNTQFTRFNHSKYSSVQYLANATKGQQAGGSLNVEYTLPIKLNVKVKSDFNYNRKFGFELASANRSEYVWNASAEYKFLSIITASVEWRDILKSQQGFNASMSGTGWSESQQYGNTSMVLMRLAVKLNGFNGGKHPRLRLPI